MDIVDGIVFKNTKFEFVVNERDHTHTHTHTRKHTHIADKSNFKKPVTHQPLAGACLV